MLSIYNTLSKTKDVFQPLEGNSVRMYVCGMTVYDYCHIGHGRSMVAFDLVTRWLRFSGYDLTYVRNITDIDDKIINRANENGESFDALTERMIAAMHEDEARLNILKPLDERQHLRHIFGGARLVRGALYAQRVGILVQGIDHAVGQAADGFAVVHGALDDFVVDVGDVAHVGHAVAAGAQPALHHIKRHHGAGMAQVAQVVHGHAADVHAHMAGFERGKRFQCTRQRVVDTQTHGVSMLEIQG